MQHAAPAERLDADRLYSTDDVCQLVGLSYRTVDYWIRRGIILPEHEAHGSGSARKFTAEQVAAFRIAGALRRLGLELDRVTELVALARDLPEGVTLIWTGTGWAFEADPALAVEAVRRYGGAAVVVAP